MFLALVATIASHADNNALWLVLAALVQAVQAVLDSMDFPSVSQLPHRSLFIEIPWSGESLVTEQGKERLQIFQDDRSYCACAVEIKSRPKNHTRR